MKYVGRPSGVSIHFEEIIMNKKWQSSGILMQEDHPKRFSIDWIYWKTIEQLSVSQIVINNDCEKSLDNQNDFLLHNSLYFLK